MNMANVLEHAASGMTADEKAFIAAFTANYCRPHAAVVAERLAAFVDAWRRRLLAQDETDFLLAAGPAAPSATASADVRAPDETVTFTFASDDATMPWQAVLTVPPGATAETMLAIAVTPFDTGILRLAGCRLPIVDGAAEMPFGLFLAGIKDVDVTFTRADGTSTAGRLQFF